MNLVLCIYDEKPQRLLQQEAVVFRTLVVDHNSDVNAGHATLMAPHFGLFSSFFSMHVGTTTLFDRLKRKKDA
jgi:hypothetical protein